ncbi:hypothetical protein G6F64_014079 [Rhizopus arrhizus]|uniref:Uncharacterized protein n=1 Tax=Rhizopus oryzae TaxID=64495 RepID=A0A9P6WU53_RHIOR|nr:hypothetical protein G6F64_014079 [Rhizopus arrhizus]
MVMKRVQNAIIERGYVTTRILAAPQDLKTGVLTLTVVPGRVNAIRFAAGEGRPPALWNTVPVAHGDVLNLRDIEQALENLQRVPTASVDIQIAPPADGAAAKPGESDLLISWKQPVHRQDAGRRHRIGGQPCRPERSVLRQRGPVGIQWQRA